MIHNSCLRVVSASWYLVGALVGSALVGATAVPLRDAAAAETTCPAGCSTLPRPADELWTVSSRAAGCGLAPLNYRLYQAGAWRPSDEHAFRATEHSPKTTVIFAHGIGVTADEALREAWLVYNALVQHAAADVPLRFILYSWPSDLHRHPLRAARSKQQHTDVEGPRLAGLVSQLSPQTPISLIGHSSGARIVAAALESLADRPASATPQLSRATPPVSRPLRAVLIAAAIDNNGLLPGRSYGQAVSQVEQMLILFNPCDRILHWYRFLERGHRGPEALGYTSLAGRTLSSADSAKLRQVNSSLYIGRHHVIGIYTRSQSLMAQVRAVALFDH